MKQIQVVMTLKVSDSTTEDEAVLIGQELMSQANHAILSTTKMDDSKYRGKILEYGTKLIES